MFEVLEAACRKYGMKINEKTKILSIGDNQLDQHHIKLGSGVLEEVESFSYLGSEIGQSAKVGKEVNIRLRKASTVYQTFHMRCIRDILGFTLWGRRRNEDLLKEADEQPIETKMKEMRLRWFGHLQRMPGQWPQKQLLKFRSGRREDQEVTSSAG